jgi:hypothetical protein
MYIWSALMMRKMRRHGDVTTRTGEVSGTGMRHYSVLDTCPPNLLAVQEKLNIIAKVIQKRSTVEKII